MSQVDALAALVARLRAECPWDRAQSVRSMRLYLQEETAELLAALDDDDADSVREELGDVLFQLVFLAQLHSERGQFDLDGVAAGICAKMVERHPHVFGGASAAEAGTNASWEQRKARRGRSRVDGVPLALPALVRAHRVAEKVAGVGFDWPDLASVLAKVDEERGELQRAIESGNPDAVAHEYGDLLLATANAGRYLGVAAEDALRMANARFEARFRGVEALAEGAGIEPGAAGPEQLEAWWQAVKAAEPT
jgi:nucleoside triphosphate diphosphatase